MGGRGRLVAESRDLLVVRSFVCCSRGHARLNALCRRWRWKCGGAGRKANRTAAARARLRSGRECGFWGRRMRQSLARSSSRGVVTVEDDDGLPWSCRGDVKCVWLCRETVKECERLMLMIVTRASRHFGVGQTFTSAPTLPTWTVRDYGIQLITE